MTRYIVAFAVATLLAPFAAAADSFVYDLGVANRDITFSKGTLVTGDRIRIYARVTNYGAEDTSGYVTFYLGDQLIGDSQVVTVRANVSYDDVWVDFAVPAGSFNIRGEIKGTSPKDQNPANDVAISQFFTPLPDADGDLVPDGEDNCPGTANADQKDADRDGMGDACDPYPSDPTNTPPTASPPPSSSPPATSPAEEPTTSVPPVTRTEAVKTAAGDDDADATSPTPSLGPSAAATLPAIDVSAYGAPWTPGASIAMERLAWNVFAFSSRAGEGRGTRVALWDFGDGETGSGEAVRHAYRAPGAYLVTLELTDEVGEVASATGTVSISFWNPGNRMLWLIVSGLAFVALAATGMAARGGRRERDGS